MHDHNQTGEQDRFANTNCKVAYIVEVVKPKLLKLNRNSRRRPRRDRRCEICRHRSRVAIFFYKGRKHTNSAHRCCKKCWASLADKARAVQLRDNAQTNAAIERICRRANLPEKRFHLLRHSFGTHSAMFGANPWSLMNWMGHKRIDETMLYVHYANAHRRPLPDNVVSAGNGHSDPDARVISMLSARGNHVPTMRTEKKKAG